MKKYDVVIVGSGMGGLVCGYMLAKEGMSVCILERNRQIGGNLQIFSRDKAIFDTGVHYLGGLDEGQNLNQFFRYLGIMDDLKLRKMDVNGFDKICFEGDDNEYPYAMGYERFVENLVPYFPKERKNIEDYCHKLQDICKLFPLYNLEATGADYFEKTYPYISTSASGFIESVTDNPKLRSVLAGTAPLYAGEYDKTPLYIHALVVNNYIESAFKCVDGGAQIARLLTKHIKSFGGEIRNYADCKRFIFSGDEIKYVELSTGETIEGKTFISNIHPSNTLDMVGEGRFRKAYTQRIHGLENLLSVFILNLVMEKDSFPYLNYNIYYYREDNVWTVSDVNDPNWPNKYAMFASATSQSEEYTDGLTVMVYMHIDEVKKWEETFRTIPKNDLERSDDYESFKNEKAEQLINVLEKKFPEIRSKIKSYYTSTPLTYRDYIGTKDGSMYGIARDYKDPMRTFIHTKTKVPNLLMTGQNVHVHGILGVTIGGIITVANMLGLEYILPKIKSA